MNDSDQDADIGWSIDLADGWEGHDDGDTSVFTAPDGVGVLQITAFEGDQDITEQDLTTLAGDIPTDSVREGFSNAHFKGFSIASQIDGEYRHAWYLGGKHLAVAVSYICNEEDRSEEMDLVRAMVKSLELI